MRVITTEKLPIKMCKLKRRCNVCDILIDDRSKSGLCSKCCKIGKNNGFYGKKHSEKTKLIMKMHHQDYSGINNSFYNKRHTEESILKMKKRHIENWKKYDDKKRTKILKNWIISGLEKCKKSSKTTIENEMYNILNNFNFKSIERNVQIGRYNSDFVVNKTLIIECYGDYWHCNPILFDQFQYNKSLKMKAFEKWNKDREKIDNLKSLGYRCVYFWENDIFNNRCNIIKIIKQYV